MLRWTRVVGFFTAVLSVVGSLQCWAFIQSERAFLTVTNLYFDVASQKVGVPLIVPVEVKNGGRSTAFISDTNVTVRLEAKLPSVPVYDQIDIQSIGPIPGGATTKIGITTNKTINEHGLGYFRSGSARFYLYGFFTYVDEFSLFGPRTIGFCYTVNPNPTAGLGPFDHCDEKKYIYYH